MGKSGFLIAIALGALIVFVVFLPSLRQWWLQVGAEEVSISYPSSSGANSGVGSASQSAGGETPDAVGTRQLKIVKVLGRDGIPAILDPEFLTAREAFRQMKPDEHVLGLSINGDDRAYPLNLLSRHEIVNDTVGGVPVAVTW